MSHDKIRAAARKRMAETGEPYAAARRAVVGEHEAASASSSHPGTGYVLRMSDEIHDWLTDLRASDEPAAFSVVKALAALMREGASLGDPLVVSTDDSWPWALSVALDRSYQENLERLTAVRRGEADAAALVKDIQDQFAKLTAAQATLEDAHRRALDEGKPYKAAHAAGKLAAVHEQVAEVQRLLPRMIEARHRLGERARSLQARAEAARARKETLKATHTAARGSLMAREAMAALDVAGDDGDRRAEAGSEAAGAAKDMLAHITAQMERELGQQTRPEGLMELWPGAPWHGNIRILFAVEPPGTALLIAVVEGSGAVEAPYPEALMASADMLHRVRAGQAPEAAACGYEDLQSLLAEFYPASQGHGPLA
jgi:hypothetical protein